MKFLYFPLFLACSALLPAQTAALFNTGDPATWPFPSDAFATADSSQKTGERVNVPSGIPVAPLLNQLDGFSVNPRIMICFSGTVDPAATAANISVYPVKKNAQPIALNQVIFDADGWSQAPAPAPPNCIYGKPNQPLAESSQYLVVATSQTIGKASGFDDCTKNKSTPYCVSLSAALAQVKPSGTVITASVFTTMSATAWLESAKKFVDSLQWPFVLPAGLPYEFPISNLSTITWVADLGGGQTAPQPIPVSALNSVDKVAFGLFLSPNFLNATGPAAGTITPQPTNTPVTSPVAVPTIIPGISFGYLPISFHVFLPPQNLVHGGSIPVVIYGHGMGDSQFGAPTYIANTLAANGFATLAMEIPGHGYGPLSTVKVQTQQHLNFTMLTPGRGISLSPGAPIGPTDGCIVPGPVAVRDCARQTAVDLMALVRTIKLTNGLGLSLDPNRIFYIGQSFGSTYGAIFNAVEPEIKAAVINSGGGTSVDVARLAISGRALGAEYLDLASPNPAMPILLNVAAGLAPPEPYFKDSFNDNYVFRDVVPVTNNITEAIPIQNVFEWADWLGMSGDPLGYAGLLNNSGKPVLVQFSYGDLEVPNPTESAFVRAAALQSSTWYLHFECASLPQAFPGCSNSAPPHPELLGITMPGLGGLPILPHRMLSNPTIFDAGNDAESALSLALQNQVSGFFSSNGQRIPNPNTFLGGSVYHNQSLFEQSPKLPETLNFIQIQP